MSYRRTGKLSRESLTIAAIDKVPTSSDTTRPAFFSLPEILSSGLERANQYSFQLERFELKQPEMSGQRLSHILYHRGIPGIIITPLPTSYGHLRLDWAKFSCIAIGYSLTRPVLHRVTGHQFRAMRLVLRQLRKKGYKKIGCAISNYQNDRVDGQLLGAFDSHQRKAPSIYQVPPFNLTRHDDPKEFKNWFRKHSPEVIICQELRVFAWLEKWGVKVPEDVGFVQPNRSDGIPKQYRYLAENIAGARQNQRVIAMTAIDFLIGMIQRNERGIPKNPITISIEPTWMDGATLKNNPPRKSIPSR